jgi:hypothetical protein
MAAPVGTLGLSWPEFVRKIQKSKAAAGYIHVRLSGAQ